MSKNHAGKQADQLIQRLSIEIERTLAHCKKHRELKSWGERFSSAKEALNDRKQTPVGRLAGACSRLNVFGGMGSWSDLCLDHSVLEGLYSAYEAANRYYQECWQSGIR